MILASYWKYCDIIAMKESDWFYRKNSADIEFTGKNQKIALKSYFAYSGTRNMSILNKANKLLSESSLQLNQRMKPSSEARPKLSITIIIIIIRCDNIFNEKNFRT